MSRPVIILLFQIFISGIGYGQTFLDSYGNLRLEMADKISNSKDRSRIKSYIKTHLIELDTVFQFYYAKTGFDFNTADTLFIIYDTPVESPFTSEILIWSGRDTISYIQGFEKIKSNKFKRIISYNSFFPQRDSVKGFKIVTERDSIVSLVSKYDFTTINHLGDNQSINDGSFYAIYIAYKVLGHYRFQTCFPRQFWIHEVYKKE
jgi:hypothetical protein